MTVAVQLQMSIKGGRPPAIPTTATLPSPKSLRGDGGGNQVRLHILSSQASVALHVPRCENGAGKESDGAAFELRVKGSHVRADSQRIMSP